MLRANFVEEGACYNSIKDAIDVARGCLHFAIRTIDRALIIQNIDKLLKLSKRCGEINFSDNTKLQQEFRKLRSQMLSLMEHYTDNMLIVVAYENYLKAKLLIEGYLIHRIDSNQEEYKTISRRQKKHPIKVSDIAEITNVNSHKYLDGLVYKSLLDTTLSISTLLSPNYVKATGLPVSIVDILRSSVKERNKLHYLVLVLFPVGNKDFQNYKFLSQYFRKEVAFLLSATEHET